MLQVKDLSIYLRQDNRFLVKDFSFSLNSGDRIALIGEEGNGKSVLIKCLVDRDSVEGYCDVKGEIFKKDEIIGYLPQNMDDEFLRFTCKEYLANVVNQLDYSIYYDLLNQLEIDESFIEDDRKLSTLSGGEKIKFMLFFQMLKRPTILLMDEPSNDLDLKSVNFLKNFMLKIDLPMIFVSHDTYLLKQVANRVIHIEQVMRRSETRVSLANECYLDYISKRNNYLENQSKRAKKEGQEFEKKLLRFQRVHDSVESALKNTKSSNPGAGKNLKDKMHTVKAIGRRLEKEKENISKKVDTEDGIAIAFDEKIEVANGKELLNLNLEELKVDGRLLAKDIHLKIIGPEKICIVGENGVGKTTLIKEIIKELEGLNLKVGYMPQSYLALKDYDLNAIEFLSTSFTKEENIKISTYLGSLNFKREEMFRKIGSLSGGQKAKLFFSKMNLDKAEFLILDEPTRNLSPLSQPEIISSLRAYRGAVLAVSHDRNFIRELFDKVYELSSSGLTEVEI